MGILTAATAFSHRVRASLVLPLLVALPAMAQGQFNYAATNGAITITQYTGPGGVVTLPGAINGLPVTSIGGWYAGSIYWGAFGDCITPSATVPA
ncbi:MAG: hypothetical protein ACLQVX_03625 [Limisphaerales bacterium]